MKGIQDSVGDTGKNNRKDVELIQDLLNQNIKQLPGEKRLLVDGLIGKKTIHHITQYQKIVMKMKNPDGRVDPNGKTFNSLLTKPAKVIKYRWKGDSSRWSQDKKLSSMNPEFRTKVKSIISELIKQGFKPKIFYGWRSHAVQLELFNKKVSKVKFSFHNATNNDGTPNSYAADIIDSRYAWSDKPETKEFWAALGKAANEQGLHWGGDWTSFKDWAHVQFYPNNKLHNVKQKSKILNK